MGVEESMGGIGGMMDPGEMGGGDEQNEVVREDADQGESDQDEKIDRHILIFNGIDGHFTEKPPFGG